MTDNVIAFPKRTTRTPTPAPKPRHVAVAAWCLDWLDKTNIHVTARELQFLYDMEERERPISEKQWKWLRAIAFRIEVGLHNPKTRYHDDHYKPGDHHPDPAA
jgi:hypothetical protein